MSSHNGSPEQIEREIEHSRERIDATLSALGQELSPGQMLDRALGYSRHHGGEFADNLVGTVSRNPLPALLAGIGITWLAVSRDQPPRGGTVYETGPSTGGRARAHASDAKQRASAAGAAAKERLDSARSSASDATADAAERVRSGTNAAADSAGRAARSAGGQLEEWHRSNPLVLGGIAFALGAALGAATPNTRREDELLGEYGEEARSTAAKRAAEARDRAADKASDKAAELGASAREKTREAGSQARQNASSTTTGESEKRQS